MSKKVKWMGCMSSLLLSASITAFAPIAIVSANNDEETSDTEEVAALLGSVTFEDVPRSHWAYGNIQYLASKEIISGYNQAGEQYFKASEKVTRAQAAKMIVESLGIEQIQPTTQRFSDVPLDNWAAGYIETAYRVGAFNGYGDGEFGVNDQLKRSQMAQVIVEAFDLDLNGYDASVPVFKDVSRDYWAFEDIQILHYNGISNGSNYSFNPETNISRAEFSALLSRALVEEYQVDITGPVEMVNKGRVTASALNVRSEPTTNASRVGSLSKGDLVSIQSKQGEWLKIRYNGQIAYVSKTYIKIQAEDVGRPLENRTIVIDAGHGNYDPGATVGKVYEKDIVRRVAVEIEKRLKAEGAEVILTRDDDTFLTLQERVDFAKDQYAEAFVSVHANSAGSTSANGAETYYDSSKNENATESKVLAGDIQKAIVEQVGMNDRGVKDSSFYVIRENDMPSVLVELGFLTNVEDREKLTSQEYLERYAGAIVDGLKEYYKKD